MEQTHALPSLLGPLEIDHFTVLVPPVFLSETFTNPVPFRAANWGWAQQVCTLFVSSTGYDTYYGLHNSAYDFVFTSNVEW